MPKHQRRTVAGGCVYAAVVAAVAATTIATGTPYEHAATARLAKQKAPAPENSPRPAELVPADGDSVTIARSTGADRDVQVRFTDQGVPASAAAAYRDAAGWVARTEPHCRLPVELLAAIGKVESGHARGGQVDARGTTLHPILGPVLNGAGFASIPDTDGGALDGDPAWDRAVGPMQFIPSTWARWAADGNSDGTADPQNLYDASLSAAHYLCADGRDLGDPAGMRSAILSYNGSLDYLRVVLGWYAHYAGDLTVVPDAGGPKTARPHATTVAEHHKATRPSAPRPSRPSTPEPAPPTTTVTEVLAPVTSVASVTCDPDDPDLLGGLLDETSLLTVQLCSTNDNR